MLDAAVLGVGWFIAKVEAENLSGAGVFGWVEPGAEDLTHTLTTLQIGGFVFLQLLGVLGDILDPLWSVRDRISLPLVPTSPSDLLDEF